MEVKPLFFDTYLGTIKNAVGSKMFQTVWAEVDGVRKDVIQGGDLACATFVTGVLYLYDLIGDKHATVKSTLEDLVKSGWYEIEKPKDGCVLVWEEEVFEDGLHPHIGFYTGKETAVSNSKEMSSPQEHHWTYGVKNGAPVRKIVGMYWNNKLDNKYFG